MRCSTLRRTFCSLITLAYPRKDRIVTNPSMSEGGGCGFTLSRSHSCCTVWLVYKKSVPVIFEPPCTTTTYSWRAVRIPHRRRRHFYFGLNTGNNIRTKVFTFSMCIFTRVVHTLTLSLAYGKPLFFRWRCSKNSETQGQEMP